MQRENSIESLPLGSDGLHAAVDDARESLNRIILGKDSKITLALACLLGRGHLLIEDLPGLGKTILAQSLARVLGLSYQRIQFTSDLLPADIIGVSIFQQSSGEFVFQKGPVFTQLVLADEINRATPKAQSALLEAMEERQVSADGQTHELPNPYFVVATQNPSDQIGTFPLPESQLDRFLMRIEMGYPSEENERELITGEDRRSLLQNISATLNPDILIQLQHTIKEVRLSDPLVDYIQALVRFTRESPDIETGLSPRGSQALALAARSLAFVKRHKGVYPDDIQAVFAACASHRLKPANNSTYRRPGELCRYVLDNVAIP
jgi:MoxR-like ATPase